MLALLFGLVVVFKSDLLAPTVGDALAASEQLDILAQPIPLNPEDPGQQTVGKLRYVQGWALKSRHERFGGFSGLVLEGKKLTAISDQGDWLTATFDPRAKTLFSDVGLHPFSASSASMSKIQLDAESLLRSGDEYLVAFEQRHRLEFASPAGHNRPWTWAAPEDLSSLPSNGGLEAISWTQDGRLLAFAERGPDTAGWLPVWLIGQDAVSDLSFRPARNFAPTDAALLPNGDILVLARFFSISEGVAIKLYRIKGSDIQPGAALEGEEIAHLSPPLSVDNMEGLEVATAADGTPLVYMLSDDNFSARQRTLLMIFALDG